MAPNSLPPCSPCAASSRASVSHRLPATGTPRQAAQHCSHYSSPDRAAPAPVHLYRMKIRMSTDSIITPSVPPVSLRVREASRPGCSAACANQRAVPPCCAACRLISHRRCFQLETAGAALLARGRGSPCPPEGGRLAQRARRPEEPGAQQEGHQAPPGQLQAPLHLAAAVGAACC